MKYILYVLSLTILLKAEIITYNCTYPMWNTENEVNQSNKEDLKMTFEVDSSTGKSQLIGNNGKSDVILYYSQLGKAITFLEVTGGQNLNISTISLVDYRSVYSRHPTYLGKIIESQYYGSCTVK